MKILNNNLKINNKLTLLSVVLFFTLGCFEKDEYESLKAHDKNNNKIIDEFEDYVNTEVNGDDLASQDLRYILFLYAENFYNIINEKELDKQKAYEFKRKSEAYNGCVRYIASHYKEFIKYDFIIEYDIFKSSKLLPLLVVNKKIYKKYAIYSGLLHGRVGTPIKKICNIKLKEKY